MARQAVKFSAHLLVFSKQIILQFIWNTNTLQEM